MSMQFNFDEDAYWERRREEYENTHRFRPRSAWDDDEELIYETESLYLDDRLDDIEKEYGCPMENLFEADLIDIAKSLCGIIAETAKWSRNYCAIEYSRAVEY